MFIPRVKFSKAPLSYDINWFYYFLFKHRWNWGKHVIKRHPEIKRVKSFKKENEQVRFLKNYIKNFTRENDKTINTNKIKYQKEWREIEKDYFKILSEILQTDWPQNKKIIKAMISVNPICPRFLNDWSFSLFYNYKKVNDAIEVIMHECCHFLYFRKWKSLYPKTNSKKFNSPYIEWHLSELVAPIILNDKRIQKYLKQKATFYKEHSRIKIENKSAPQFFTKIYMKNIEKPNSFDLFLEQAYKEIKKRKKLFLS